MPRFSALPLLLNEDLTPETRTGNSTYGQQLFSKASKQKIDLSGGWKMNLWTSFYFLIASYR